MLKNRNKNYSNNRGSDIFNEKGDFRMNQETYDLMEEHLKDDLNYIKDLEIASEERTKLVSEITSISKELGAIDQRDIEFYDRQERRRIEEEKNKASVEIESKKNDICWKRVAIDFAKLMLPSLIYYGFHWASSTRMFKFEETGRITSTVGKILGLPKERR